MSPEGKDKRIAEGSYLAGNRLKASTGDFGPEVAWNDHKIRFAVRHAAGRSVLDIGCVEHDPENYRSRYWVHKALREVAAAVVGLDLYVEGVQYLRERGYNVVVGDAQCFSLGRMFDVIFAGDVIEHIEDSRGFLASCKAHMHPGSRLLISTPNPWYWKYWVRAAFVREVPNNPEHVCWYCPRTLRQLVARHGMRVGTIEFGSRYLRDRLVPLPCGIKHTSFHAEILPDW